MTRRKRISPGPETIAAKLLAMLRNRVMWLNLYLAELVDVSSRARKACERNCEPIQGKATSGGVSLSRLCSWRRATTSSFTNSTSLTNRMLPCCTGVSPPTTGTPLAVRFAAFKHFVLTDVRPGNAFRKYHHRQKTSPPLQPIVHRCVAIAYSELDTELR